MVRWISATVALGILLGCSSTIPATEVVLVIDTDLRKPGTAMPEFDSVAITIGRAADVAGETRTYEGADVEWPIVLPSVPKGGVSAVYADVRLLNGDDTVLRRSQTIRFASKRRVRFDMTLHRACAAEDCDGSFTCSAESGAAKCGPAVIDGDDLAPWTDLDGGDGGDDAGEDPAGLVAWYTMDDYVDGTLLDASGNGHHGVCTDACPTSVAGKIGAGAFFKLSEPTPIEVPYAPAFNGAGGFTVSAWVKPVGQGAIVSKPYGTVPEGSWLLYVNSTRKIIFEMTSNELLGPELPTGEWSHVAGSWDGTTQRLYANGVLVDEAPAGVSFDDSPVLLGIDKDNGMPLVPANGSIDDVRIYSRALSADEIADLATP